MRNQTKANIIYYCKRSKENIKMTSHYKKKTKNFATLLFFSLVLFVCAIVCCKKHADDIYILCVYGWQFYMCPTLIYSNHMNAIVFTKFCISTLPLVAFFVALVVIVSFSFVGSCFVALRLICVHFCILILLYFFLFWSVSTLSSLDVLRSL